MERYVLPDAQAAADACARRILAVIGDILAERPFATLAVSGGSLPKLLFRTLAASAFPARRVHLFWADERSVPPDDPESNYRLALDNLIGPAGIPAENVHRVRGEMESGKAAEQYSQEVREFFHLAAGALPAIDIVQLGMGPDGHTASLFPGETLITDRTGIAAASYSASKLPHWRVTLLPGVLLSARNTVYLVSGADKAEAARAVLFDEYQPDRWPAQLVARHAQNQAWYLDESAASHLG